MHDLVTCAKGFIDDSTSILNTPHVYSQRIQQSVYFEAEIFEAEICSKLPLRKRIILEVS
jgi:hypothetical protein